MTPIALGSDVVPSSASPSWKFQITSSNLLHYRHPVQHESVLVICELQCPLAPRIAVVKLLSDRNQAVCCEGGTCSRDEQMKIGEELTWRY